MGWKITPVHDWKWDSTIYKYKPKVVKNGVKLRLNKKILLWYLVATAGVWFYLTVVYNRASVDRVMGFFDDDEYEDFITILLEFEKMLVRSKIHLNIGNRALLGCTLQIPPEYI